jgi:uncharacterized protein YecE (DUF72 family)
VIRVGTAGWSYADWQGRVYPTHKPAGFHPLAFLARYFDCVELNSTFYALPLLPHVERWSELVRDRPDFRFTAKLLRAFTHEPWPPGAAALGAELRAVLAPLARAGRLSALLAQFPHSFQRSDRARERLVRIAELFAGEPLVFELRHASWFEPAGLDQLIRIGCPLAHIDLPPGPDQAPAEFPPLPGLVYVRLHGRNHRTWFDRAASRDQRYDYLYSPDEVRELVERVRRLARGRDETVVVTNNHFAGQAVANALELRAGLEGVRPLAPTDLVQAFPGLRASVRTEGQGTLF